MPGEYYGFNLQTLQTVDSTNAEAIRRLNRNDPSVSSNTVIHALQQTGGRGRRGRHWFSPVGNLYCTFVVRPDIKIKAAANAGYVMALAVYDFIAAFASSDTGIQTKWPNDVLLNGKKTSGILLESSANKHGDLEWLVIGVGINIEVFPDQTSFPSTALRHEGLTPVSVSVSVGRLARCFSTWYDTWCREGFESIRGPWIERARGIGDEITVRLENGELSGMFSGIDQTGALLLHRGNETRVISAGDVFFPDPV